MPGGKCFSTGIKVLSFTVKVSLLLTSLATNFRRDKQQDLTDNTVNLMIKH